MKNLFSAAPGRRWLKPAALGLGLLAAASTARAQAPTPPTIVYALAEATQNIPAFGVTAGQQTITELLPATLNNTSGAVFGRFGTVSGVAAGYKLEGLDYRPATGELYGLAINRSVDASNGTTPNAQLYVLTITNVNTLALTANAVARGAAISLNVQDTDRNSTTGTAQHINLGFDFNPTVDRIRVVAPNGTNYRINPNTGARVVDTGLSYVTGNSVGHPPYVGTAAYDNSLLGLGSTTLYDLDITNTIYPTQPPATVPQNRSYLSIQSPPNDGVLNPQPVQPVYQVNSSGSFAALTSPTVGISLDIAYSAASGGNPAGNLFYLLEARPSTNGNFSNNFYAYTPSNGQAIGRNIVGGYPIFYIDLATPLSQPITWVGSNDPLTGTEWNVAANWSTNQVPTSTDVVVIPGTGTSVSTTSGPATVGLQPIIKTAQAYSIQTVNLASGGVLTVNGQLNILGNFFNNDGTVAGSGLYNLADNTATLNATHVVGGNALSTFANLDVRAPGASTSGPVAISRQLQALSNLAIGSTQPFTLLSSASGTAYVYNNGGAVTGLATVQRYITTTPGNPGLGYRHYSSPVTRNNAAATSNTIADLGTGTFTPTVNAAYNSSNIPRQVRPYPTVFYYDQSRLASSNASYAVGDFDNGFLSPGALTDVLVTTRGYTVNLGGGELVDFQGTLNTGPYNTGALARGAQAAAGYHLLGNPYPGAISFSSVLGGSSGIEGTVYVYKSSGQYTGSYAAYTPASNQSTNGGSNNIPLGQGFFVRAQAGGGSVSFSDNNRTNVPETALFQRGASTTPTLALTLSSPGAANQTRIYFDAAATSAFDADYDAHYLPASHGLDLGSDLGSEKLAINGLPVPTGAAITVPLYLHAAAAGTYTLTVDELANLPTGYHAYLRDGRSGTLTDLDTTPSVSVALAPADAATGRFTVVFATSQPLANAPATLAALVGIYPNPAHGAATLVLPQALRGQQASQVEVLNALGQVVLRRTVAAASPEAVELPLTGLTAGLYTVRATTATGTVAKQLHVE